MYLLQWGMGLVAFSPSVALTWMVVGRRAELIIISVSSAVMWLLAVLIVSVVWKVLPGLKTNWLWVAAFGAGSQEVMRWTVVRGYRWIEALVAKVIAQDPDTREAPKISLNDPTSAIAAGVGFGTMHVVVIYGSLLAESGGSATAYTETCSGIPLLVTSGLYALLFLVMDILLMVMAFDAEKKRDIRLQQVIVSSHVLASIMTALSKVHGGCLIGVAAVAIVVGALGFQLTKRVLSSR